MTRLQEARARLREAEATLAAVTAEAAAAEKAAAPAKAKLARIEARDKRNPLIVKSAGMAYFREDGISGLSGYGWEALREHAAGKSGRAAQEAVAKAILAGEVTINLGGGTSKCAGLAKRTRIPTPESQRTLRAAIAKRKAAAARLADAQRAEREAVLAAFDNGNTIEARVLASAIADHWLTERATNGSRSWLHERRVEDAQRNVAWAKEHLAHVPIKGKEPCPCTPCVNAARKAQFDRELAERDAAKAKAAAAWERLVAKAKTLTYACPHCAKTVSAKAIPTRTYGGDLSSTPYVKCPECHFAANSTTVKVVRKAAAA